MSQEARGLLRLSKRYEGKMKYVYDYMVENRYFHIEQLKEAIACAEKFLEVTYDELANWGEAIQSVYEVDEFDHFWERIELVFLKKYVNWRYARTYKETQVLEEAKKRLEKVLNQLLLIDAFRR